MRLISDKDFLIVGLGLIGGSYARALKRLGFHVEAIDTKESAIEYALENEIIDAGYSYVNEKCVSDADVIIFALYPEVFREWIVRYQHLIKNGVLITDVTGVKGCIVRDIQELLRPEIEFIAAHPMAGREVYGVENSDDRIFRDANFIVVPTEKNSEGAIEWCKELGRILGCRNVTTLTPEEHDEMIGFVSQLTHCIAVSLMTCNDNPKLVDYTGDSFRDLTRIARINEDMWSELFLMNREALLKQMNAFESEFDLLKEMLESGDREGIKEKMRLSTARRSLFDKK
ncbi:MAG: prephenate dehydrogenase [Lachnospiraceae bacterium]